MGQASASMGGRTVSARSAEGQESASMGGGAVSARSVVGQASVSTGGSAVSAARAVTEITSGNRDKKRPSATSYNLRPLLITTRLPNKTQRKNGLELRWTAIRKTDLRFAFDIKWNSAKRLSSPPQLMIVFVVFFKKVKFL